MERQVLPHGTELGYWKDRADHFWSEKACLKAYLSVLEAENAKIRSENTVFIAQVRELEGQIEALKARVLKLTQQVYGCKSEQQPPPKAEASRDNSPHVQGKRPRGQQKGAKGHGRRQYAELPERIEIHDIPKEKLHCPCCGLPYDPFPPGEETSTRIDWRVRVERVVDRRLSYHKACRCPEVPAIITAPPPLKVIPKGLFTAEFIARLMIEKYVLGRPLHRIGAAMHMEGLDLAQGALAGVFQQVSALLSPLYDAIHAHCLSAGLWQADETGWKIFEEVEGKASNRWWLWAFASPDTVVFVMDPSRSAAVPKKFFGLTGDNPAKGLLGSDFYRVYQVLGETILSFFCWG